MAAPAFHDLNFNQSNVLTIPWPAVTKGDALICAVHATENSGGGFLIPPSNGNWIALAPQVEVAQFQISQVFGYIGNGGQGAPTTQVAGATTDTWRFVGDDAGSNGGVMVSLSNMQIGAYSFVTEIDTGNSGLVTPTGSPPQIILSLPGGTATAGDILLAIMTCSAGNLTAPATFTTTASGLTFVNLGLFGEEDNLDGASYATGLSAGTVPTMTIDYTDTLATPTTVVVWGVSVKTGPTVLTQPSNASCQIMSGQATFSVTAQASSGSLSYQWQVNGTNVSSGTGGTTSSYTTATGQLLANNGDVYTCIVTDGNGTTTSAGAILSTFWPVSGPQNVVAIGALPIGTNPTQTTTQTNNAPLFGTDA